jgi:hypothetical protein
MWEDVGGPSKGWMRKGEEGSSIETAMYSVYILNQERNHVTKSHVKMQFTVYRVNQGARLTNVIARIASPRGAATFTTPRSLRRDFLRDEREFRSEGWLCHQYSLQHQR